MAGRGFSFKDFKPKKEDDKQSTAPSTASSAPFLNVVGRGSGRGFVLPCALPQSRLDEDAASAASMSSIGMGRGVIAGRGMFALKPRPTPQSIATSAGSKTSSDRVESSSSTTPKDNSASSGIIAGRGMGTSGRGTGSGRGSSGKNESTKISFISS